MVGNVLKAVGDEIESERRRKDEEAAARKRSTPGVVLGDFREVGREVADESTPLVFVDPPYDRGSAGLYGEIAAFAARVLVDGGSMIAYCPHYLLPQVIGDMADHLTWFWLCCCQHAEKKARMTEYGIVVHWKPMAWLVKGGFRRDRQVFVDDLVSGGMDKSLHRWQQGVHDVIPFIEALSHRGDVIIDPCCGAGTTATAAKMIGRRWWTCDIDVGALTLAWKRIHDTTVQ